MSLMFHAANDDDVFSAFSHLITVEWFGQSANTIVNSVVKQETAVWRYQFNHKVPTKIFQMVYPNMLEKTIKKLGVAHAVEIPYVFN